MAQEDWEVVRFPAIAEEDEMWVLDNELGQYLFTRQRGEALHPERQPRAILDQIRRTIGEYNFAGQYQQAPSPQGGGMVKAVRFRNYAANERPDKFDQIVQCWDTATRPQSSAISASARVGASRARTCTYCMCCASAWNIPN